MLSEKEKAALDGYITYVPEKPGNKRKVRKNAFGESIELYEDDLASFIYDNDKVYLLTIQTETDEKEFYVLFDNAQELLDEFEEEIDNATIVSCGLGKTFKKEMEELLGE